MLGKLLGLRKLFVDQDHVLFAVTLVYDQCYVRQLVDFTRHSHKREGVIEDKDLFRIWESRFKCVFDNSRI